MGVWQCTTASSEYVSPSPLPRDYLPLYAGVYSVPRISPPSTYVRFCDHRLLASRQSNTLEEIFEETLHVVLRSWHSTSNWVDSAQILISVRSISIDATVRPVGGTDVDADAVHGGGGGERDFMVFRLEPAEGGSDFYTEQVSGEVRGWGDGFAFSARRTLFLFLRRFPTYRSLMHRKLCCTLCVSSSSVCVLG